MKISKALETNQRLLEELEKLDWTFPASQSISALDSYISWSWMRFLPEEDTEEFLEEVSRSKDAAELWKTVYEWRATAMSLSDPLSRKTLLGVIPESKDLAEDEKEEVALALQWSAERLRGEEIPESVRKGLQEAREGKLETVSLEDLERDLARVMDAESDLFT